MACTCEKNDDLGMTEYLLTYLGFRLRGFVECRIFHWSLDVTAASIILAFDVDSAVVSALRGAELSLR